MANTTISTEVNTETPISCVSDVEGYGAVEGLLEGLLEEWLEGLLEATVDGDADGLALGANLVVGE
jgi:hypothetical protein